MKRLPAGLRQCTTLGRFKRRLQIFAVIESLGTSGKVVFDLLQCFTLGLYEAEVKEDCAKEGDAAVDPECARFGGRVLQVRVSLDDDENEHVSGTGGHAANQAADLRAETKL